MSFVSKRWGIACAMAILALLSLLSLTVGRGIGDAEAAESTNFTFATDEPFGMWGDSKIGWQPCSDGGFGYCHQLGVVSKGTHTYTVTSYHESDIYANILGYGYPNTKTFNGVTFGDEDAFIVTQFAIWFVCGDIDIDTEECICPSAPGFPADTGWYTAMDIGFGADYNSELKRSALDAAKWLVEKARNNIGRTNFRARQLASDGQQGLYWLGPQTGSFKIHKTQKPATYATDGVMNDFPVSGAKYDIYTNSACSGGSKGTLVIGNDGWSNNSPEMEGGNYWVRERTDGVPAGYKIDHTAHRVEIVAGTQGKPYASDLDGHAFEDELILSHVRIAKRNKSTGNVIPKAGFQFKLYKRDGTTTIATATTDPSGYATFDANLAIGKYWVQETGTVEPFHLNSEKFPINISRKSVEGTVNASHDNGSAYSVDDATNTITVDIADQPYAFVNVIKKNDELDRATDASTVKTDGFKFRLYTSEAAARGNTGNYIEEIETAAGSGTKTFATKLNVMPASQGGGVYYVRESAARKPYNVSNAVYRITLKPAAGIPGDLGDVQALIEVLDESGRTSPYTTAYVSYLGETKTTASATFAVRGEADRSGTDVHNVATFPAGDAPQYGRATILKTDKEDGSLQRGAEYQIYAGQNIRYATQGGATRNPTAGHDAIANPGQSKAPNGYTKKLSDDVNATPPRHATNTDVALTTAIDAGEVKTWDPGTGKVEVLRPVTFMRNGNENDTYDTIVTDAHGRATTGWLPIGDTGTADYYFVEVKTSNGRIIDGTPIKFTLTYDNALQDWECIRSNETTNVRDGRNDDQPKQTDQANVLHIHKSTVKTEEHEEGDPVKGVTIGLWKQADDIGSNLGASTETPTSVVPKANDGTYSYDSIVIRTSDNTSLVPRVHQRVLGAEIRVSALPSGIKMLLRDTETGEATEVTGTSKTIEFEHDMTITLLDGEGEEVGYAGESTVKFTEGTRVELTVTTGPLGGCTLAQDHFPIESRSAVIRYATDRDAWIATDLKANTRYEVEFGRHIVKVIDTSENGGHVWYGRYSAGEMTGGHEAAWFRGGWLDQAAMPNHDSKLILNNHMRKGFIEGSGDGLFTTNAVRTQDHQSWLQDTEADVRDGSGYDYPTVTDENGDISWSRIGSGDYVLAEIAPPVDETHHKTYLVDPYAHHFNVDETTGYIKDTDDPNTPGYSKDHHEEGDASQTAATSKSFSFRDDVTKMKISKKEMAGGDELVGARLILTAENNDVIDEWTSKKEPHYIEDLVPGRYTLTELITPKQYDKAESMTFNLLPSGEIQHYIMFDSPISIDAKIDKRQEIANPLSAADEANGDGRNRAEAQTNRLGNYAYSLDFKSTSTTWTDEFTVEDPLEPVRDGYANLVSITTPQVYQDYDGKMNVWYKTKKTSPGYQELLGGSKRRSRTRSGNDTSGNYAVDYGVPADEDDTSDDQSTGDSSDSADDGSENDNKDKDKDERKASTRPWLTYAANATLSDKHENSWLYDDDAMAADKDGDCRIISYDGWRLWKKDIDATVAQQLYVSDLGLKNDDIVTAVRFEYGRVEVGFTSRPLEWEREILKDEHDDLEHVHGLNGSSFLSAATSADSAIARMDILANRFTNEAAIDLRARIIDAMAKNEEEYDKLLADIEDHNLTADQAGLLRKFKEIAERPAHENNTEASDFDRLTDGTRFTKERLTAAFMLCTTEEGRDVLRGTAGDFVPDWRFDDYGQYVADMVHARETLVQVCHNSMDDIENSVRPETEARIKEALANYETELLRLPDDVAGEDHDTAMAELLAAYLQAVDDIRNVGLSGRVMYAPAIMNMELTRDYVAGRAMRNSARVDAYRNGGNTDGDEKRDDGKKLEGHDEDEVVQTAKRRDSMIGTRLATETGEKIVAADGTENVVLIDTVDYHGLVPGVEYEMQGELHIRHVQDGKPVDGGVMTGSRGSTMFIPETPDGTVDVRLVMPAKEILFESTVAYEELRAVDEATGVADDVVIAYHRDIADDNQTVNVTELAEDFRGIGANPLIQTGGTVAGIAAVAAAGGTAWLVVRKRRGDKVA